MEPNLQNIPIRTPEGRRIRQAFVAPPGWCIVAADYSQIELRIMAHLSGDEGLLNAFAEERDIHQATAADVFGMTLDASERGPAAHREDDQLRTHLRHVRVRARVAARHRAQRGAALCGPVFRALSGRTALHGRDAPTSARARLCRNRIRPAALSERHRLAQRSPAARRRARGDQRADARHGRGHHQARHDRGRPLVDRLAHPGAG